MGDIAEMMLDGTLCEGCGVYLGEAEGYPKRCRACQKDQRVDALRTATHIQKFALERPKRVHKNEFPWSSCAPFVENSRGTLIHRPRTGSTYNIHRTGPHVGLGFWCGMHVSSGGKNLTFLAAPPEGRILCERCEAAAVANGLPSADELTGRHVHKGRTVAVATCCDLTPNAKNQGLPKAVPLD